MGTYWTGPDCLSYRGVWLIESGGNVTPVILKLNLFITNLMSVQLVPEVPQKALPNCPLMVLKVSVVRLRKVSVL